MPEVILQQGRKSYIPIFILPPTPCMSNNVKNDVSFLKSGCERKKALEKPSFVKAAFDTEIAFGKNGPSVHQCFWTQRTRFAGDRG